MDPFDQRLDAAIDRLLAGEPADTDAGVLPLLRTGAALMALAAPMPALPAAQQRMQQALRTERMRKSGGWGRVSDGRWFMGLPRFAAAAAVLFTILALWSSTKALPGQPGYTLKRGMEAVPLLISGQTNAAAARHHVTFASRRLGEMEKLLLVGQPVPSRLLEDLTRSWEAALANAAGDQTLLRDQAGQQAERLQRILPSLETDARPAAQAVLAMLLRAAGGAELPIPPAPPAPPPPSPTPSPSPNAPLRVDVSTPVVPTATSVSTSRQAPAAVTTPRPRPGAANPSPAATTGQDRPLRASTPSATPAQTTPQPTSEAGETPESDIAPDSTATAQPTRTTPNPPTRQPNPTSDATATREPVSTTDSTGTPEPDGTPDPDDTPEVEDTPKPENTPESEDTPVPKPSPGL